MSPNRSQTNRMPPDGRGPEIDENSPADLARLAELVAIGLVPFPTDWTAEHAAELLTAVRQVRRARLVQLIAVAIAQDILSEHDG